MSLLALKVTKGGQESRKVDSQQVQADSQLTGPQEFGSHKQKELNCANIKWARRCMLPYS